MMKNNNVVTLPITSPDNDLQGVITVSDIAESYMDSYDSHVMSLARTQYRSIADTLDGSVIVGNEHGYFIRGKVVVGAFHPDTMENYIEKMTLSFSETVRRTSSVQSRWMQAALSSDLAQR